MCLLCVWGIKIMVKRALDLESEGLGMSQKSTSGICSQSQSILGKMGLIILRHVRVKLGNAGEVKVL